LNVLEHLQHTTGHPESAAYLTSDTYTCMYQSTKLINKDEITN